MRNVVPLVGLGCATVFILGIIIGGIVMIVRGVGDAFDKKAATENKQKEKAPGPQAPVKQPVPKETRTLLEARKNFETNLGNSDFRRNGVELRDLPGATVEHFTSPAGKMVALLSSPLPKKGAKKPAVIWIHDGFGGITAADWAAAKAFHGPDFVLMVPSFRGENEKNDGEFEMFYGEVDDLLAAIDYVATRDGVDRDRIYVVGHGTGGTLALLASVSGNRSARAFFAIGGTPHLEEYLQLKNAKSLGGVSLPFDPTAQKEAYLRSAFPFVGLIRQPTFFFGASAVDPVGCGQATRMEVAANQRQVPFRVFIIPQATRANFSAPLFNLFGQKIKGDTAKAPAIRFEHSEVLQPFNK